MNIFGIVKVMKWAVLFILTVIILLPQPLFFSYTQSLDDRSVKLVESTNYGLTSNGYADVNVSEAKQMIESNLDLVILDVRTVEEYNEGHIEDAILIPVSELEGRIDELDEGKETLVYCRSGVRSVTASQILVDNGFSSVYNMLGGITAWRDAACPVYVKYPSIQEAINNVQEGDTIYVSSGIYYENVVVDKTVSIVGENRSNTVIDGSGAGTGISVTADHVTVEDFGVQNCEIGIKVESNDNIISSNLVSSNGYNESELLTGQEIYQDYVSPTHRWYLHNMINSSYSAFFNITEHTPAISVHAYGKEDVNQLGIGLFHDENGDNIPQLQEYKGYMDAKELNVQTFLVNPPVGQYIIKVLGWEVPGEPGHFDLEIKRYTGYGIIFLSSSNNIITENPLTYNPVGLYLYESNNSTIRLNDAMENVGGIVVSESTDCVISKNNVSLNTLGTGIYEIGNGITLWSVHGFYISENNVSSNLFGIWLFDSSDNEVIGNDLVSNPAWGLNLYTSYDNTVHYNNIFTSGDGIRMMFSCQNNFIQNHFESNGHAGIFLWLDNDNNSITSNKFYSNGQHGVELKFCDNNTISDNDIRFNGRNGILIIESTGCMVTRNHVFSNQRGIMFYDAYGNKVYHNNVVDSWEQQAADIRSSNIWDDGYPSGGNYWNDHNSPDEDLDKIGDNPYFIEGNSDTYPLIYPYGFVPRPDVNEDGIVNIIDLHAVARAFDTKPGDDNWNSIADVEMDETINIKDLYAVAKDYGKTV